MKKRKVVTLLASLALVAVVGVGGTLAYLSDQTQTLTNRFTMTDKGINIGLDEAAVKKEADGDFVVNNDVDRLDASEVAKQQEYEGVLPNTTLPKDPTVTVKATSDACYVFVSVKDENDDLTIADLDETNWIQVTLNDYGLTGDEDTTYYRYKDMVPSSTSNIKLPEVFTKVNVGTGTKQNGETVLNLTNIVVKASAVQAAGENQNDAYKEALILLGAKANQ